MIPINNNNQIIHCLRSHVLQEGGYRVTTSINSNTTPELFEEIRRQNPGYQLQNGGRLGWNALGVAVKHENLLLIRHIAEVGGSILFNYANEQGLTPLHIAAENNNPDKAYELISEIVRLGSEVNLSIPEIQNYTPLVHALKTNNLHNVRILLSYGAVIPDNLDEDSKTILRFAITNTKSSRKI